MNSPPPGAVVLFADEADLNLHPTITRCWAKIGEQKKVDTPRQNHKAYALGAVDYHTGEVLHLLSPRKDRAAFSSLVARILEAYPKLEVYLVVDNFICHKRVKVAESRLKLVYLPTYSPHLNPIEKLWRYMRWQVSHNYLFSSIENLKEAVARLLAGLNAYKDKVLQLIKGTAKMSKDLVAVT